MATSAERSFEGLGFVQFLDEVMRRRLVSPSEGAGYKVTCLEVLPVVLGAEWDRVDVKVLDVEDLLEEFQARRGRRLTAEGAKTYRRRLHEVFRLFRHLTSDPVQPDHRKRTDPPPRPPRKVNPMPPTPTPVPDASQELTYPFPLRPGVVVTLSLPTDLTSGESARLARFLDALAIDDGAAVNGSANGHGSATARAARRKA